MGWNYWQLELLEQGFRGEGIAKTMFSQKSFFGNSKVVFLCFLEALGAGFLPFSVLETGLNIECFFKVTLGILNGPTESRHWQSQAIGTTTYQLGIGHTLDFLLRTEGSQRTFAAWWHLPKGGQRIYKLLYLVIIYRVYTCEFMYLSQFCLEAL